MSKYQVMYWKHIPSQVKAWEEHEQVKAMLPDRFQVAIDAFAMKDGSTDMDAYLAGWSWGPVLERHGTPEEVLVSVISELDSTLPRAKLMEPPE